MSNSEPHSQTNWDWTCKHRSWAALFGPFPRPKFPERDGKHRTKKKEISVNWKSQWHDDDEYSLESTNMKKMWVSLHISNMRHCKIMNQTGGNSHGMDHNEPTYSVLVKDLRAWSFNLCEGLLMSWLSINLYIPLWIGALTTPNKRDHNYIIKSWNPYI